MQGTREEWMHVFFICSGFYVFSTIVYALLASGVEQPWAKSDPTKNGTEIVTEIAANTEDNEKMTTQF